MGRDLIHTNPAPTIGRASVLELAAHAARRTSSILLRPRAAYVLAGEARSAWQHSVSAVKALRYAITFRSLK